MGLDTSYVPVEMVQQLLVDIDWSVSRTSMLSMLCLRASRALDSLCHVEPGAFKTEVDQTRYFMGSGKSCQDVGMLAAAPTAVYISSTGSVTTYDITLATTDYFCWPYNYAEEHEPIRRLEIDQLNGNYSFWYKYPKSVKIVGPFGYSQDVPYDVEHAVSIQVVRWFQRAQQMYADAGVIAELSQMQFLRAVDPDVEGILAGVRELLI